MAGSMATRSGTIPSMRYRDAHAAIDWLCNVLGFSRHAVYDGPHNSVAHAELVLGNGMVMLGSASNTNPYPQALATPMELGAHVAGQVYVVVPDCDAVYARARNAQSEILQPLRTMEYGGRAFTLRDPEGYVWSVGEYDPWAGGRVEWRP